MAQAEKQTGTTKPAPPGEESAERSKSSGDVGRQLPPGEQQQLHEPGHELPRVSAPANELNVLRTPEQPVPVAESERDELPKPVLYAIGIITILCECAAVLWVTYAILLGGLLR